MPDLLRLLLDQNFPKPRWDVHQLDRTVEYVHLSDWGPDLASVSTPDWLVQLAAHAGGFHGVVTSDYRSVDQDEEAVALDSTTLSVVTWAKGIDNPVVQWGSLLAYMPQIRRLINERGPFIVTLPVPTLTSNRPEKTRGISKRRAAKLGTSAPELRANVLDDMVDELRTRGREDLIDLLEHPPRRGS